MQILLTNDDGIYAPGLAAMENELRRIGDVCLVAPATEQSGVGHSITYLHPLICKEVYDGDRLRGYAVEGSPADCVKIGVFEFCQKRPQLVVSGINSGLNAGINVLYSGTVAAAIEGAFCDITSIAVSLEFDEHAQYQRAARLARHVIEQILSHKPKEPQLYNLNIPTAAVAQRPKTEGEGQNDPPTLRVAPMAVAPYGEHYIKRQDPRGRTYYWAGGDPPPQDVMGPTGLDTDLTALAKGFVTLTPLQYNMTKHDLIPPMEAWRFQLPALDASE